jgi:hypothetical protein
MDECEIGKPYRVLVFSNDFYNGEIDENKNYIEIKNEWKVPVMIKGVNRNLLTVGGTSGNYNVASMGDTTLAKELQQRNKYPDESDTYYLLRVPQLAADFFAHETNHSLAEAEFVPLSSAAKAIPALSQGGFKAAYSLSEVEQMVKQTLTQDPKEEKPIKSKTSTPKKKK